MGMGNHLLATATEALKLTYSRQKILHYKYEMSAKKNKLIDC